MREKNDVEVLIGGIKYTLCGYESPEYMLKIAAYINTKIDEINNNTDSRLFDNETRNLLLQLNIADDYFKSLNKYEVLDDEKKDTDRVLFDLKHELVEARERIEELTKANTELEVKLEAEKKRPKGRQ